MKNEVIAVSAPSCEELLEALYDESDAYEKVCENSKTGWRHGTDETVVFKRKSDETFWQAQYRLSTDGETNGLREGDADISRVYPKQVTTTIYTTAN